MGLKPITPQWEDGFLIEPPVSEPRLASQNSAATDAAEPDDEPPGILSLAEGLRVGPKQDVSPEDPHANSSMFAVPIIIASSLLNLSTTVASYPAT